MTLSCQQIVLPYLSLKRKKLGKKQKKPSEKQNKLCKFEPEMKKKDKEKTFREDKKKKKKMLVINKITLIEKGRDKQY